MPIDRFAPITIRTVALLAFALNCQTPIRYTAEERQAERAHEQRMHFLLTGRYIDDD